MSRTHSSVVICVLSALSIALGVLVLTPARAAPPTKWEFKVVSRIDLLTELYRDELGKPPKKETREALVKRVAGVVITAEFKHLTVGTLPDNARYSKRLEAVLQRYGDQGWQLATALTRENGGLILQRRVQ